MRRAPGRFALLIGAVALLVLLLLFFQSVAGNLTAALTGAIDGQDGEVGRLRRHGTTQSHRQAC